MTTNSPAVPSEAKLKPVVLCADDFGMAPGINAGIVALANQGRLSAASCMSRGAFFQRDAHLLARLPLEFGLHLNFTEALDTDGFCQPLPRLLWNCFTRQLETEKLTLEIERQLDAFEAVLGRTPDYVDGHQHVHQFPLIRECLLQVLRQRYPKSLPWLRSTQPAIVHGIPRQYRLKASLIAALGGRGLKKQSHRFGFRMNAHLLGVYGFDGGEQRYQQLLDAWVESAGQNDLIMCHPAQFADSCDPLSLQRVAEYQALCGRGLETILERRLAFVKAQTAF